MKLNLKSGLAYTALALTVPAVLSFGQSAGKAKPDTTAPLKLARTTQLPGISGDFDHFAVDLAGERLFLVGEDHQTLEVISVKTGKSLTSIKGFGTPHSVLYLPVTNELYVTDGGDGTVKVLNGTDYKVTATIKLVAGADSIGFDRAAQKLYVVTGGKDVPLDHSFLTAVDLPGRKAAGDLRFEDNHVEAMALETSGPRIFINVTDKNQLSVVDRTTMKVTASWPIKVAEVNSPIAFDEANHRLFIVCRKPGTLVVLNSDTGEIVAHLAAADRADDVAFDKENHRIYVPGGVGFISVIQQKDADHYELIAKVPTAAGAKTALLVPELHTLFVAVSPGDTKAMAKVLAFDVRK